MGRARMGFLYSALIVGGCEDETAGRVVYSRHPPRFE